MHVPSWQDVTHVTCYFYLAPPHNLSTYRVREFRTESRAVVRAGPRGQRAALTSQPNCKPYSASSISICACRHPAAQSTDRNKEGVIISCSMRATQVLLNNMHCVRFGKCQRVRAVKP